MSEPTEPRGSENASAAPSVEDVMQAELAYGDTTLGTVAPILGHLVLNHDHTLFSDEMVARVRGMLASVARQLLDIEAAQVAMVHSPSGTKIEEDDDDQAASESTVRLQRIEGLVQAIASNSAFLQHCHSLAIEFQLVDGLKSRNALDPVLTPLLQAMIADKDTQTASAAMATLAAQARFMQQQRRMSLPLAELPPSLAQNAIRCWRDATPVTDQDVLAKTMTAQRTNIDEARSRLGLIQQLLNAMGRTASGGMAGSLSIAHAGASIFLSALATIGGTSREEAAQITNDRQMARLALTLRGAGLQAKAVEEQFHYLHPDIELPENFDKLRPDKARMLLGRAS